MRLLITGASGFVGLNLVRFMAASGAFSEIVTTDRAMPDEREMAFVRRDGVQFIALDVSDRQAVRRTFSDIRPTHVIHGAAVTPGAALSPERTADVFAINLSGSINVFEAAALGGVERVVSLSSSGVYAHSGWYVRREDDPLALDQPYAGSKRAAEIASLSYLDHTDIVSARLGPIYGPMERIRPTRTRMSFLGQLEAALQDGRPITISGPDIVRDWTFADDMSEALLRLLVGASLSHRIYNISSGQGFAMSAVADCFRKLGLDVHWETDGPADIVLRKEDERTPLSIDRLRADTGFSPSFDLQQGIAATVRLNRSLLAAHQFQEADT